MTAPSAKAIVKHVLPASLYDVLARGYRRFLREPYLLCRTWYRCRHIDRYPSPRRLELGPGTIPPPEGWLTLDIFWTATFYADLRGRLPFPDACFADIYCSHVFEHFTLPELRRILSECLRILEPGGSLDVVVPNGGLYVRAYGDGGVRRELEAHLGHTPDFEVGTRMDLVNHMAHMCGEHRYLFDEENLVALLRQAGFGDVHVRPFDDNREHESRRFESICATGRKQMA